MLRLLIPASWPIAGTSCAWTLRDDDGRLLQSGYSDPRTWPDDGRCEVILSADQCLCLHAEIPNMAGRLQDDVVVMALEERLLGDIDDEHWVVGKRQPDGRIPVSLVRRQRVADVIEALRQLGRQVCCLVWESRLVAATSDGWVVVWAPERGFVCADHGEAWAFSVGKAVVPLELSLALSEARQADLAPKRIELRSSGGPLPDPAAWTRETGIQCVAGAAFDWRTANLQQAEDFLCGPFAAANNADSLRRLRPALWVTAITLLSLAIAGIVESTVLMQRQEAFRAEVVAIYKRTFPGDRPILDAYAQLQADTARLANRRGEPSSGDFLVMLAQAGDALEADAMVPTRVKYEDRQLRIEFAAPPKAIAEVVNRLQSKGYSALFTMDNTRPPTLVVGIRQ